MVDLHTHSTYSDGTWSVKELLERANHAGVSILSITDHNTTKAYFELNEINIQEYFSGNIIVGCEFNAMFNNVRIELLGYNFDYNIVQEWLDKYQSNLSSNDYDSEFQTLVHMCKIKDIFIDRNYVYDSKKEYPIAAIYKNIIKYPENLNYFEPEQILNEDTFFRNCTSNTNFPLYLDFTNKIPDALEISELIRNAGGIVFLAHPFLYSLDNCIEYIFELKKSNIIDGVETYYSSHTPYQTRLLERFCYDNELLLSGGSDCHGDKKVQRKIGVGFGNLNISDTIIREWVYSTTRV